jgi:hypothetical protein
MPRNSHRRWIALLLASVAGVTNGWTQTSGNDSVPQTLSECELNRCDPGAMGTWTFTGRSGLATWPNGGRATLTVERFDAETVVIHRIDSPGSIGYGIVGQYTGTRHGDVIDGTLVWTKPGGTPTMARWHARIQSTADQLTRPSSPTPPPVRTATAPPNPSPGPLAALAASTYGLSTDPSRAATPLPSTMRFCGPIHCATLTRNNGRYDAVFDDMRDKGAIATFAVDEFKPDSVLIRRIDSGGATAILVGDLASDGNSVMDGAMSYQDVNGAGAPSPFQLSWGDAIDRAQRPTAATAPADLEGTTYVTAVPLQLKTCETNLSAKRHHCGTWVWTGQSYRADWTPNTTEEVVIDRWTTDEIAFHLYQPPNGMSQTGTGHFLNDGTLVGMMTVSWPGHWPDSPFGVGINKVTWSATVVPTHPPTYTACNQHSVAPASIAALRTQIMASALAGDLVSMVCWVRAGAVSGDAPSQLGYSYDLLHGNGVPVNRHEAIQWAEKAAEEGLADAQLRVAEMYSNGTGVAANPEKAHYWKTRYARTSFDAVLARVNESDEDSLIAAINTCLKDPENARNHTTECMSAYHAHLNMLRAAGNYDESCREEHLYVGEPITMECVRRNIAKAEAEEAQALKKQRCGPNSDRRGKPECQ